MCKYHLKQRIENALAPIRGQPGHPLWAALEDAFFSPADWAAFEQLAWNRTLRKPTPVVWKMEAYPWKTQISWREFFLSLLGRFVVAGAAEPELASMRRLAVTSQHELHDHPCG